MFLRLLKYLTSLTYFAVTGEWSQLRPEAFDDAWPTARASAASVVVHGSALIVHGGYNGEQFLNDMWICPLERLLEQSSLGSFSPRWRQLRPGRVSSPRSLSGADGEPDFLASPQETNSASVGSFVPGGVANASLPDHSRLPSATQVDHQVSLPSPRSGHSMIHIGPLILMFGGRHAEGRYNDVHVFNMEDNAWSFMPVKGRAPCGRKTHSFARIRDQAYVFGGHSGDSWMGDIFTLHLQPILARFARVPKTPPSLQTVAFTHSVPSKRARSHGAHSAVRRIRLTHSNQYISIPGLLLDVPGHFDACQTNAHLGAVEAAKTDAALLNRFGLDLSFPFLSQLQNKLHQHSRSFTEWGASSVYGGSDFRSPEFWSGILRQRASEASANTKQGTQSTNSSSHVFNMHGSCHVQDIAATDLLLQAGEYTFQVHQHIVQPKCEYLATLTCSPEWKQTLEAHSSTVSHPSLPLASAQLDMQSACAAHSTMPSSNSTASANHLSASSAHQAPGAESVHVRTSGAPTIQLAGIDGLHLAAALYFMYFDLLPVGLTDENVQDLLVLSDQLQIASLSDHCQRLLEVRLTISNVSCLLEFASSRNLERLLQACVSYAANPSTFPAVAASGPFLQLPHELARLVIHEHAVLRAAPGSSKGGPGNGSPVGGQAEVNDEFAD